MVLSRDVSPFAEHDLYCINSSDDVTTTAEPSFRIIYAASCRRIGRDNINMHIWCDPFETWQLMYSFIPLENSK